MVAAMNEIKQDKKGKEDLTEEGERWGAGEEHALRHDGSLIWLETKMTKTEAAVGRPKQVHVGRGSQL
jgi:hypothetical protein